MLNEEISCQIEIYVWENHGFLLLSFLGLVPIHHGRKLTKPPYLKTVEWSNWYVFWAEEKVIPGRKLESNYMQAKDEFLSKVFVPSTPSLLKYAITKVRPQYPQYYVICPSPNISYQAHNMTLIISLFLLALAILFSDLLDLYIHTFRCHLELVWHRRLLAILLDFLISSFR